MAIDWMLAGVYFMFKHICPKDQTNRGNVAAFRGLEIVVD